MTGVLPGVLVLGIGLVLTVAPLTSTAMSSAPGEHAGLASAVNNDVARAAGLLAVAILPLVRGLTGDAYLHPAVFAHGFPDRLHDLRCDGCAWAGHRDRHDPQHPRADCRATGADAAVCRGDRAALAARPYRPATG